MIHIVTLKFDYYFNDSDAGNCWAGESIRIIKLFRDEKAAENFCKEWNPIFKGAENENTIVPRQPFNKMLKDGLGFDVHDLEQNTKDFELCVESYEDEA